VVDVAAGEQPYFDRDGTIRVRGVTFWPLWGNWTVIGDTQPGCPVVHHAVWGPTSVVRMWLLLPDAVSLQLAGCQVRAV
jgi:hypothetical protein